MKIVAVFILVAMIAMASAYYNPAPGQQRHQEYQSDDEVTSNLKLKLLASTIAKIAQEQGAQNSEGYCPYECIFCGRQCCLIPCQADFCRFPCPPSDGFIGAG